MADSTPIQLEIQFPEVKLCECGCGMPAPLSRVNNAWNGRVKGQPQRFVKGHRKTRPVEDRFWEKVDKSDDPDACWLWRGARRGDYGIIKMDGRNVKSHRASWEIHFGPIPEHDSYHGICVLHKCDNPPCVRPDHLFLGTNDDNMADKVAKNRQSHSTGAPGEACGAAKLTDDIVREIRMRVANGEMQKDIAREIGVAGATVSNVVNRKTWRHI